MAPGGQPRPVLYCVTATVPDEATAADYLAWLAAGHMAAVLKAGALTARAARAVEPAAPIRIETCYLFPSRAALRNYETSHAPALRAEGVRLFAHRSVTFDRRLLQVEFDEAPLIPPH